MPDRERREDLLKRLSRIFRTGTAFGGLARNRVPIGNLPFNPPMGTGREFLKGSTLLYTQPGRTPGGPFARLTMYAEAVEMDSDPIIASALNILADETTNEDEMGDIIKIFSPNHAIRDELESLFFNTLTIESFLWMWTREMCKYGDHFLLLDLHEDYGIVGALPIPCNEIERIEGFDKEDPLRVKFRWMTHARKELELFEIIHFRLLTNTGLLPYGRSFLDPARRIWRSLISMEDAFLVYRLIRAPERRIFYIDVGNTDPEKVEPYMKQVIEQIKANEMTADTTGVHDMKYNALSVLDDLFIPVRGTESGTKIDSLPTATWGEATEDLEYFRKKLIAALMIPPAFLTYEESLSSKATLSSEDIRLAKTIRRIQNTVLPEIYKMALIHLYAKGYRGSDLLNYEIKLAVPSHIAELQNLEIWRTRLEVASSAAEGMFSRDYIYRILFKLSDEEIKLIYMNLLKEKRLLSQIEQAEWKPPEEEGPKAGEEEKTKGVKLPEPGGAKAAEGEGKDLLIPPSEIGKRPFGNKVPELSPREMVHRSLMTKDDGVEDPFDRKAMHLKFRDNVMDNLENREDVIKLLSELKVSEREERSSALLETAARKVDSVDFLIKKMERSFKTVARKK